MAVKLGNAVFLLILVVQPALATEDSIAILPPAIHLTGDAARQEILVERIRDGQYVGEVGDGVILSSSDENVVVIEAGTVRPIGNGRAEIRAEAEGSRVSAQVVVDGLERPHRWSFRNHVLSVMAKASCSPSGCPAGR